MVVPIVLGIAALWFTTSFGQSVPNNLTNEVSTSLDLRTDTIDGNSSVARSSVLQISALPDTRPFSSAVSSLHTTTTEPPSSNFMNEHEIRKLNSILDELPTTSKALQLTQQAVISKKQIVPLVTEQTTMLRTVKSSTSYGSNANGSSTIGILINGTSYSVTSHHDVVLATKQPHTSFDDIFKKSLTWMSNSYTLSIVVPVLAGFLFATVLVLTLVIFTCIRRRCGRRKTGHKIFPDMVRKMGSSDRAKLLAESSDEEF